MWQTLRYDLLKNGGATLKQILRVCLTSHSFHLLALIRIGTLVRRYGLIGKICSTLIEYLIRIVFSSDISCGAKIGRGLIIMHGHDIVIGSGVYIGDDVKIFNGVTLGNKYTETQKLEQPYVGNNVVLSTGAKILGNISIGDNVVVGANSVVLADIPADHTAVGVPARYFPSVTKR
jgi:serine O-acetyltransferase